MLMGKTQRKVAYSGIAIISVGLAIVLSQLGYQFGTGSGAGDGDSDSAAEVAADDSLANVLADTSDTTPLVSPPPEPKQETPKPDTTELLTVIIVGKGYYWATNHSDPTAVEPIAMEAILQKAKETKGNPQGLRVRIFRAGSALPSAENQLMQSLQHTGLPNSAILFDERILDVEL